MATLEELDAKLDKILDILNAQAQRGSRPSSKGAAPSAGTFRFGRSKGQPLAGAPPADLEWYRGVIAASLDDPGKARWRDDNEAHLAEIDAALGGEDPTAAETLDDEDIPF